MNRRQILSLAIIAVAVLLISAAAVALMPAWVIVLLIRPGILTPVSERATQSAIKYGTKQMFKNSMKTPTQPMGKIW
jgi:hypothetical protein